MGRAGLLELDMIFFTEFYAKYRFNRGSPTFGHFHQAGHFLRIKTYSLFVNLGEAA